MRQARRCVRGPALCCGFDLCHKYILYLYLYLYLRLRGRHLLPSRQHNAARRVMFDRTLLPWRTRVEPWRTRVEQYFYLPRRHIRERDEPVPAGLLRELSAGFIQSCRCDAV